MRDVVILSGARTAIGSFGGSLASVPPVDLATHVARHALERAGVDASQVEHVVFGNVIHTEARDMYLARAAAMQAGLPDRVPALTLNRLCGSGLQAVISAAQHIMLGDADLTLAGGAESMSRAPHASQSVRTGQKMGSVTLEDMLLGALNDPFGNGHMGMTAENVAREQKIDRERQDAVAVESHRRASRARAEGRFADQIAPLTVKVKKSDVEFAADEHIREGVTLQDLAKLRPVFDKTGSVTAGNASGVNDGAAAVVLMSAERATAEGRKPMGRILGYTHAGVDPKVMGLGPIPAVRRLLERTGLSIGDFDVVESNEAFASQCEAVSRELGLDPERTNPNGGAIALGHPIGATGAILLVKTIYELARIGGRRGLITMCIGGGQGIALAVERS